MKRTKVAGGLLVVAALSFWSASAIHFGLRIPIGFMTVSDPFRGAAIPEAILGVVTAVTGVYLLRFIRPRRVIAAGAIVFTILVTLYGLSLTVGSARIPDVVYHVGVLLVLTVALILLAMNWSRLGPSGRHDR